MGQPLHHTILSHSHQVFAPSIFVLWLTLDFFYPGQGLAMLEISLTLATLYRRYDLALETGFQMEFLPSFTLCAKNGLRVRVTRR